MRYIREMARKPEFDRDDAVTAAADTFWEKGYVATSLDDLTGRLGIGRASLYNAFGDKRALFIEALSSYLDNGREVLRDALASRLTGREALALLVEGRACCNGRSGKGCLAVNVGVELNGTDQQIQHAVVGELERVEDTVLALIRRGQADGSIRAELDAAGAARAFMALIVGMQSMKRIGMPPDVIMGAARAQLAML